MKIHHRYTGAVIYEAGAESMAELVMEAVRLRANLTGADLTGAYLTGTVLGEHSKGAQ